MAADRSRGARTAAERLAPAAAVRAPAPARRQVLWRARTTLQQRRPAAVRRHALRTLLRAGVLAAGDLAAGAAVAALATLTAAAGAPWSTLARGAASTGFAQTGAALLLGLAVAGNYGRRVGARSTLHVARGALLASALTMWSAFLAGGTGTLVPTLALAVALTLAVRAVRAGSARFLGAVWPGVRGGAAAVVVGNDAEWEAATRGRVAAPETGYRLVGRVCTERRAADALGTIDELPELIATHDIETIIVGGQLAPDDLELVLDVSDTAGCELLYSARSVTFAGVRPKIVWRAEQPFFELSKPVLKAHALLVKRCVDVVGAVVGLVVLAPVLAAIAAAIRVGSPGPTFFAQDRAGLGGRRFRMIKFRTMRVGADAEKAALAHLNHTGDRRLFKIQEDPRVTRIGRWLRRWSLDELPQLWNVLRGEMSIVGPRPFFESDLDDYEDHHFRRLGAKPGITGLWQVNGRSAVVDFEEVVRLDREYIEQWSLWLDLRIVLKTVPAVLGRTGAW